ncbi:Homeobox-leucine zipper protein HAT2 [Apostasia shenzhenica]|uniref:Homeobox-leucine zipper protein HAT2 n=1 Tax=Apostasia shenzhenica TaxID=1088818 RepID=A0A2I0A461_9ASPA|nr:Homeobox-leucine zipper protein HAT2 [Apostasia shenzhenica]
MMAEKDGLGLSLSLSSSDAHRCTLHLNLMPPASSSPPQPLPIQSDPQWTADLASPLDPAAEKPLLLRRIDVNRAPAEWEAEDDVGVSSSPNSTVSTGSATGGKRGREEHDAERASDEEDGDGSRKKLRLSKEQSTVLEESFKEHNTLNPVSLSLAIDFCCFFFWFDPEADPLCFVALHRSKNSRWPSSLICGLAKWRSGSKTEERGNDQFFFFFFSDISPGSSANQWGISFQDEAEADGGGLRVFEAMLRESDGGESTAAERSAGAPSSQAFPSVLHAHDSSDDPHHVPFLRARRRLQPSSRPAVDCRAAHGEYTIPPASSSRRRRRACNMGVGPAPAIFPRCAAAALLRAIVEFRKMQMMSTSVDKPMLGRQRSNCLSCMAPPFRPGRYPSHPFSASSYPTTSQLRHWFTRRCPSIVAEYQMIAALPPFLQLLCVVVSLSSA